MPGSRGCGLRALPRAKIMASLRDSKETYFVMNFRANLLWIDGLGALIVGLLVVGLSGFLSSFYGLPRGILLFTGVVNLIYCSYSLTLAARSSRSLRLIKILVVANLAWTPVCFTLAALYFEGATVFGLIHLIGEGIYVGSLACLEWCWREWLVTD